MERLLDRVRVLATQNIGFAAFMGWNYILLYGCAMAVGKHFPFNLEYIWLVASLATVLSSALILYFTVKKDLTITRRWGVAAAISGAAASISLWVSYAIFETYPFMFAVTGVLAGCSITLFTAIWGDRLSRCNETRIEFDIPSCFLIAFALYSVTLPIKLYGIPNLAICCALPMLSAWFAFRSEQTDPDICWSCEHTRSCGKQAKVGSLAQNAPLLSGFALIAALWFVGAFFRVVDAPVDAYNRYFRYLIPFVSAFVVTIVSFSYLMRNMRFVNLTMAFRWMLPFALSNILILCIGNWSFESHLAAYAVIHIGIFGVQISSMFAVAKYQRRVSSRPVVMFLLMAFAEGLGIFLGAGTSLLMVTFVPAENYLVGMLAAITVCVLVVMAVGFSPEWHLASRGSLRGSVDTVNSPTACAQTPELSSLEAIALDQAAQLRDRFGLTDRETEIAALMLRGRNRPFIRDELGISLNTVHAHARNILAKCGVHSQQELMNLLLSEDSFGCTTSDSTCQI